MTLKQQMKEIYKWYTALIVVHPKHRSSNKNSAPLWSHMIHVNTVLLYLLFAMMFMDILSWKETIITTNLCTLEWLTGFSDICK